MCRVRRHNHRVDGPGTTRSPRLLLLVLHARPPTAPAGRYSASHMLNQYFAGAVLLHTCPVCLPLQPTPAHVLPWASRSRECLKQLCPIKLRSHEQPRTKTRVYPIIVLPPADQRVHERLVHVRKLREPDHRVHSGRVQELCQGYWHKPICMHRPGPTAFSPPFPKTLPAGLGCCACSLPCHAPVQVDKEAT